MAKHGAAAALLIASLLVAVALAGAADARRPLRAKVTLNHLGVRHVVKPLGETAAVVPALTCSKVHGVQQGETCFSIAQGTGLTQDNFLAFNPNINCQKLFIGQWVCLAATP
ncbi:unnamed protein product [Urochloa humidicola]